MGNLIHVSGAGGTSGWSTLTGASGARAYDYLEYDYYKIHVCRVRDACRVRDTKCDPHDC